VTHVDKLTASGQLIAAGCFAIGFERLRLRSAYQGQWSRLRFSGLTEASFRQTL